MSNTSQSEPRLESWKAIAQYLNRDVRTVRRWEAAEGLPVHRHQHLARSSVYAFPGELDAWRASRRPEPVESVAPASRTFRVGAVAAIALLALTAAGDGLSGAAANTQIRQGQTVRAIWTGDGVDAMGSPSRDGRYLSYTDWATGDLALRDLVGGNNRRLTDTGGWEKSGDFAEFSSLSPDGRQIAYAWFVDRGETPGATTCQCRYQLRLMDIAAADSGKPRVLMSAESADFWVRPAGWMPDGRSIVVARTLTRGTNEVGIVNLADGVFRLLRSATGRAADHVSISPDGAKLAMAVAGDDGAGNDIILIDTATGRETRLITHLADDYAPVFSADGQHVLFMSDRTGSGALWRVAVTGNKPEPVMVTNVPDRSGLLGSTAGGAVYYFSGGALSNILMADIDAAGSRRAEPVRAVERFVNGNDMPVFSPDGRQIAYYSRRGAGLGNSVRRALMIHTLATGQDREVPVTIQPFDGLSWFPDGRGVLVTTRETDPPGFVFHRVDVATGASQVLVRSSEIAAGFGMTTRRPMVAPDGAAIVFADDEPNAERKGVGATLLRRFDLKSREIRTIARTSGRDDQITSFAIAGGGSQIAYLRYDGRNRSNILEVIPAEGGPARELYRDRHVGSSRFAGLAWTRDGRYVLFVRADDGSTPGRALWRVPAAGGPAEATGFAIEGTLRFPSISPDGSRIAFSVAAQEAPVVWALENFLPSQ